MKKMQEHIKISKKRLRYCKMRRASVKSIPSDIRISSFLLTPSNYWKYGIMKEKLVEGG
jgi:hypothetical protein